MMKLQFLTLVKTVTEEGNLAHAAQKLYLTPSALSHQLKALESDLGFKIFHRTRNNWQLTQEGQTLYGVACDVLGSIERGMDTLQAIQKGSKGTVRISTECYSFYQGLPALVQHMAQAYPAIQVRLVLEATHQSITKILSQEIDMALVTTPPASPELMYFEVYQDEVLALMHCDHALSELDYLEARHFAEVDLIIHSFPLETVSVYQRVLAPRHIHPASTSAIPLTEVALSMVQANMGVACFPKWALQAFQLPDSLRFVPIGKEGLHRKHYLIARKADGSKSYIQDFIQHFCKHFSQLW